MKKKLRKSKSWLEFINIQEIFFRMPQFSLMMVQKLSYRHAHDLFMCLECVFYIFEQNF